MINLSQVANSPAFAQTFKVLRSVGVFSMGVWQSTETQLTAYGPISTAKPRDLQMVPEGDKVLGAMVFWSSFPLFATHYTQGVGGGSSDKLSWNNHLWRILEVSQYQDYGFYRAVAVRLKTD